MEFWKSRTFWVVALGAIFNILVYFGVIAVDQSQMWIDTILFVLAGFFRWTTVTAPLTVTKQ
jgi:hypothetical protein